MANMNISILTRKETELFLTHMKGIPWKEDIKELTFLLSEIGGFV